LIDRMKYRLLILACLGLQTTFAQNNNSAKELSSSVNVFLGSSGDHGQLSPAASYPFSMMSIGPQTYPNTHTGYEHNAKEFIGFTHNRFEGVGCTGSGGNLFIKPFLGKTDDNANLIKATDNASPGYYSVGFSNKINAELTVFKNEGRHRYRFPKGKKGFTLDLGHSFNGGFVAEGHSSSAGGLDGWITSKTTCGAGEYKLYYHLEFSKPVTWSSAGEHRLVAVPDAATEEIEVRIYFSSTNAEYARKGLTRLSFDQLKRKSTDGWNAHLNRITVRGDKDREKLFYSMLYRTIQSPYQVSEPDGVYHAINGSDQNYNGMIYNGWAIWDNYRTQLPLLSVAYPERYQDIAYSIANLYKYGKKDYATKLDLHRRCGLSTGSW
jgi:putative alpha-1,2-mannosidase